MTKFTDQVAHFLAALGILCVFATGGVAGGVFAGLGCGLIRELSEAGGARIAWPEVKAHFGKRDPWIDLFFWTLGGVCAALLLKI